MLLLYDIESDHCLLGQTSLPNGRRESAPNTSSIPVPTVLPPKPLLYSFGSIPNSAGGQSAQQTVAKVKPLPPSGKPSPPVMTRSLSRPIPSPKPSTIPKPVAKAKPVLPFKPQILAKPTNKWPNFRISLDRKKIVNLFFGQIIR